MALPRAWGPLPGQPKAPADQGITTYYKKHPQKPKAPKAPRAPGTVKPLDPNTQAQQNAMSAFRTALAQLNASTPAVDSAAIYAPYRQSEQITGQLGQGLQQHVLDSGAAAQAQYGTALGQAQQQAAQFGISAGAGANPTALQNTGAAPLAQQTNAYAAAAPQAAAQWQALLERTAGAKVAEATLAREQGLTSARQSLATALPTAIGNEEDRGFQRQTQRQNIALARTQLTQKQNEAYNRNVLDQYKADTSANTAAANRRAANQRAANSVAAANERSANSIAAANQRALKSRATAATAKGLKGVPAALKALSGTTSGGSTKKVAKGWDVQVQPHDADGNPLGPVKTMHGPRKDWAPAGYKNVGGATTHYATAPNTPGKTGITPSQWDAQMRALLAQNPGQAKAVKAFLGPRPKK